MEQREFQDALAHGGLTRYAFAQKTGMRWETIDGYWKGATKIPKKVDCLVMSITGWRGYGKTKEKKKNQTANAA